MIGFRRNCALSMPLLAVLAGCGNDLESRNSAVGLDGNDSADMVIVRQSAGSKSGGSGRERTIDGLGEVDQVSDDFAVMADEGDDEEDADGMQTVVDASPDDLRDMAQGFAPEPLDDASGIDPSPITPEPVSD